MQPRDRTAAPPEYRPDGSHLAVDARLWQAAASRDRRQLCDLTFFDAVPGNRLQFAFLGEPLRIDLEARTLLRRSAGAWTPIRDPLLELATVLYLSEVRELLPMGREIVAVRDLRQGHFFAGPHELILDPLLVRFGADLPAFRRASARLAGTPLEMGDAACRLLPFPRLPLYYLLWIGDAEFQPRIQVLCERSIETVLAADAIWALINRVSQSLAAA
jgi:hypothetical protein